MAGHEGQVAAACAVGLAAAVGFATANALQHRAAGRVPDTVERALGVLVHLAGQRLWLVATAVSFGSMLLHAVALRLGSLALVQPLMLVGVVLAVPLRAGLERTRPSAAEVRAVATTAAGLALFVVVTNPRPSQAMAPVLVGGVFLGVCAVAALLCLGVSAWTGLGPQRRAAVLGVGAGLMFGVTAGLLKAAGRIVEPGGPRLEVVAVLAGLVVAGILGVAMNQRAYQLAPLAFSMPLVNVVDILVAMAFGVLVFGENPSKGLVLVIVQGVGLTVMAFGLTRICLLESSSAPTGRGSLREAWS